jgi:cytosine/uracil/thiamine/allantoin permease
MTLETARRWRNSCMIVAAVGFVIWGADFVQQLDGFGVYKPTTMARSGFGMALFPLLVSCFPWIATFVYNSNVQINDYYRKAMQGNLVAYIAIEEYKKK